jgi:CarboxypepD_reg-like domain
MQARCFNKSLNVFCSGMAECSLFLKMTRRFLLLFIMLINAGAILYAQQQVKGKIYSASTDSVVNAASVYNKNLRVLAFSGSNGFYTIQASEGDTLIFSAIGYMPDTLTVQFHMLLVQNDITLQMRIITLQNVNVTGNYSEDSLNRRNYYKNIFKKQPGVTGYNRPADGFGIVLSPLSYLSRSSKQKRTLKKRLLKQDQDDYIDRQFPAEWVSGLTGLKGDSLNLFMYRYRPSYEFCRKTDRQGMIIYISDKLKEFMKPKGRG